jgi:hypothetical protein
MWVFLWKELEERSCKLQTTQSTCRQNSLYQAEVIAKAMALKGKY